MINGGNSLIQPVNARDLGKSFYSILMSPQQTSRKIYNLSGDRPIKMIEVFNLISEYMGKKRCFISVPLGVGVLISRLLKLLTLGKIDYVEKVQRMGEDRSYSHKEATRDFGYKPMSFEEGLRIEVNQYLNLHKPFRKNGSHDMKIAVLSSHTPSLYWFRLDMMKDFIKHESFSNRIGT